jgi:hypothetical protein
LAPGRWKKRRVFNFGLMVRGLTIPRDLRRSIKEEVEEEETITPTNN